MIFSDSIYRYPVRHRIGNFSLVLIALLVMASCSKEDSARDSKISNKNSQSGQAAKTISNFSVDSITRGALVFQERCAECHGPRAQGHPGWSPDQGKQTKDVKLIVAPPLDGSGVAHKRKKQQLVQSITNGVRRNNILVMPEWRGRLSSQDVEDVITWFQALWPPKVYEAWNRANQSTKSSKTGGGVRKN